MSFELESEVEACNVGRARGSAGSLRTARLASSVATNHRCPSVRPSYSSGWRRRRVRQCPSLRLEFQSWGCGGFERRPAAAPRRNDLQDRSARTRACSPRSRCGSRPDGSRASECETSTGILALLDFKGRLGAMTIKHVQVALNGGGQSEQEKPALMLVSGIEKKTNKDTVRGKKKIAAEQFGCRGPS